MYRVRVPLFSLSGFAHRQTLSDDHVLNDLLITSREIALCALKHNPLPRCANGNVFALCFGKIVLLLFAILFGIAVRTVEEQNRKVCFVNCDSSAVEKSIGDIFLVSSQAKFFPDFIRFFLIQLFTTTGKPSVSDWWNGMN